MHARALTDAIRLIPAIVLIATSVYGAGPTIVPTDSGGYKGKYKETESGYVLEGGSKNVVVPKADAQPVEGGKLVIKRTGVLPFGCAHGCCPSGDCDTTCCAESASDAVLECKDGKANMHCKTF